MCQFVIGPAMRSPNASRLAISSQTLIASTFALLGLASCGGSVNQALTGTVATGAPVINASVSVMDSKGLLVGSGVTDSTGAYNITVNPSATPPLIIKASGIVGDSTYNLYGVSSKVGVANVSQVTTAIAAGLSSNGNPADTYNNAATLGLTSQAVQALDSAYTQAFSNLIPGISSFISSSFNSNLDGALDNIRVEIKPSGSITLATTSNLASNDLLPGVTAANPLPTTTLTKGQAPGASVSTQLTATVPRITVSELENLRHKLEACFALPPEQRGTPSNPAAACADANFVVSSDPSIANGFKHSGFRWNNSNWNNSAFNPTSANTSYHYGMFGYALAGSTFNGASFLKPRIIRPLDGQGTSWIVQFPIVLSSGALTSLGDGVGNKFLVVKKIDSLVSGQDSGFRFVGDQRDYLAVITPTVQKMASSSATNYQTGFNLVFKKLSSTDSTNRKAVLANVKGKGLPPGGIYLAQNDASCGTTVAATLAISFLNNVSYEGAPLDPTRLASKTGNGSASWSGIQTSDICTAVLRMSETGSETGAIALKSWGSDGQSLSASNNSFTFQDSATGGGNWLADGDLSAISTGEPYRIKIWLSDGSTVSYINRLPTSMLSLSETQSYPDFPNFNAATKTAFTAYTGTADFPATIVPNPNIYTFQVGMFWNGASTSSTGSLSPNSSSVTLSCGSSCSSGNWMTGFAMIKAFARTVDSLAVSTVYWNY